eukprot:8270941-Alexandrium_andersonii.AAC.1
MDPNRQVRSDLSHAPLGRKRQAQALETRDTAQTGHGQVDVASGQCSRTRKGRPSAAHGKLRTSNAKAD